MSNRKHVYIERSVWDNWNRDHIAKHDVTLEEAEEVVAGDALVHASHKGRLLFLEPTLADECSL